MRKILVVDDEQDLCYFVKRCLEKTGEYEVVTTSLPEDVSNLCQQEHPDLVLLDIVMPNMRGEDVIKLIHKDPQNAKTLIVVTSGLGEMTYHIKKDQWRWEPNRPVVQERGEVIKERSSEKAAQVYGVDDFLAKPFSPETLLLVLKELFERQSKPEAGPKEEV